MGVLGLWQLLAPVGQPVTLESLENKIFAVDISIWLNQAVKGYRDSKGGSVTNAHLLSLFSRLCKLLFYRIRPIIVFDGGFPELKKQTIINRQQKRAAVKHNSQEVGLKILTNYLASQQLEQGKGISSNVKVHLKHKEKPRDEIYNLPPLPESSQKAMLVSVENEEIERKFSNFSQADIKYLNQIDLDSEDFHNLPLDVKLEILSSLKESRRHRTWDHYEELPQESNDFSKYQMQCLLKKRKLQSKLEQVQSDLRKIHSSAYVSQYTNDHVIGETNKIMSDDSSYYVLLKKVNESKINKSVDLVDNKSNMNDAKNAFIKDLENIDIDDDCLKEQKDFNKAIINSLSDVVKIEKHSLELLDDEYAIDNPPVSYTENQEIKLKSSDLKTDNSNNLACVSSFGESSLTDKHELKKEILIEDIKRQENELELKVISKEQKVIDELVVITSDDEIYSDNDDFIEDKLEVDSVVHDQHSNATSDKDKSDFKKGDPSLNQSDEILSERNKIPTNFTSFNLSTPMTQLNCPSTSTIKDNFKMDSSLITTSKTNEKENSASSDNILKRTEVANNLPETFNEDLQKANLELQTELETAASILEAERAKQDRQARTVQDHMVEECKELLQLFGVPYIVSPLEAEAQCAFYDKVDLTHGTITDDSDVWLFGGKRVYKNFFTQQKFVECYKDKEIFHHFGLSREKLINFALLTGSDYTEGIDGVGHVTAMEIISEFPGEGIDALKKFKNWWDSANKNIGIPENKVRAKLKKLVLSESFPEERVFDAYLNPEVDSSTEKFTWGRPDLDALREYTREKFGWSQNKVDDLLLPVIKKLNEKNSQTHIDSFFTVMLRKEKNLFPSKRIMSALKKITSPQKSEKDNRQDLPTKRKAITSKKNVKKQKSKKGPVKSEHVKSFGPNLSESSCDSDS